jgi:hypothetical protein
MNREEKRGRSHSPLANGNRRRVLPVDMGSLAPPAAAWHGWVAGPYSPMWVALKLSV